MPGTGKSEDLCLEVRRFNSIVRNSALLCSLLKKPQHFQRYLTKNGENQVDRKTCYFHVHLQCKRKSTVKWEVTYSYTQGSVSRPCKIVVAFPCIE